MAASIRLLIGIFLTFVFSASAEAASFSGVVKSVSKDGQTLTVTASSGSPTKTFTLSSSTKVTLDSRKVKPTAIEVGQRITVFSVSSGRVTNVIARKAVDSNSSPTKTNKKPETTSPAPMTTAKTSSSPSTGSSEDNSDNKVGDWPQFRGADRTNRSKETGLLKTWPTGGPELAWRATGLGEGYSSVSIVDGVVFTMGNRGQDETVVAFDLDSGREIWAVRNGNAFKDGQGNGPRGTPSVSDGKVFALGGNGDLSCIDAKSGTPVWSKNILQQYGGKNIVWGISESPLIDGDKVIVTPGGSAATMVALRADNGAEIWKAKAPVDTQAGYSSAVIVKTGGVKQYVNFVSAGLLGVNANTGAALWGNNDASNSTANCSSPLEYNGNVFYASGYSTGGSFVRLSARGNSVREQSAYKTNKMQNHHGGMVIVGKYLYGSSDPGVLRCIEVETGKVFWENRSVGKGSIVYADGHLIVRSESGPVALVEASPTGYNEKGRFDQPNRSGRPAWPHPVVANGKLFLRDQDSLLCYRLK